MSETPPMDLSPLSATPPAGDPLAERSARARLRMSLFGREDPALRIDRFVLLRTLGQGGLGIVHAAYDPMLRREVAIKVMRYGGDEGRERMVREARALAKLSHPNVISIYEVGTFDDAVFLVVELIQGQTLDRWRSAERRSVRDVISVMIQAGRGLAAAHAVDLIHRDFKPHNCIVDDAGQARVLDFGLARVDEHGIRGDPTPCTDTDPSTTSGAGLTDGVVGTVRYMAPEQARGEPVSARSDQFSFAVTTYELLVGRHPFVKDGAYRPDQPLPPLRFDAGDPVPGWIRGPLEKALQEDPEQRHPSMEVLLGRLDLGARQRRRVGLWFAGVAVAAGALGYAGARPSEAASSVPCPNLQEARDGIWSPSQRAGVGQAFAEVSLPRARQTAEDVDAVLSRWADAFAAQRVEVCAAGSPTDPEMARTLALRRSCLDSLATRFSALVSELATIDARGVDRASKAVRDLETSNRCADIEGLLATEQVPFANEQQRHAAAEVTATLAHADALHALGRFEPALAAATAAASAAEPIGHAPTLARAQWVQGRGLGKMDDLEGAQTKLQEAFETAIAGRDDETAALAATGLIKYAGQVRGDITAAQTWARVATATLTRVNLHRGRLRAEVLSSHAAALVTAGKLDAAEPLITQAILLYESEPEPGGSLPDALATAGAIAGQRGEHAGAVASFERALTLARETLGPAHPFVGSCLANLGAALGEAGEYERSLETLEQAQALILDALGPEHPHVVQLLASLAQAHRKLGHAERSLELAREGYDRSVALFGREHLLAAMAALNLATALAPTEPAEARTLFTSAHEIYLERFGPDHANTKKAALGLSRLQAKTPTP